MKTILIADDNPNIIDILVEYAKHDGYNPITAADGDEALEKFYKHQPDVILLDVSMPKQDGFSVCRTIRENSQVPIIMVTARGEDFERIMGLDIGADDYIVKPFSPGEVMARVRAIMRRLDKDAEQTAKVIHRGNLRVFPETYGVTIDGQAIKLTKKEFEIIWLLTEHPERVYTREQLLDQVWGMDYFGDTRTVDSHVKRLRAKLSEVPHPEWSLSTVWGVGYRFRMGADEQDDGK